MEIHITSPAFANGDDIPTRYTCDGQNVSPPLQWDAVPEETQAIALICDDPDAPMKTFVHWVLYNLPPAARELPENAGADASLPDGAEEGVNDFAKAGYGGPCPPSGTHRYYFKIYALDRQVKPGRHATKDDLLKAVRGHILGQGQLMGRYTRQ